MPWRAGGDARATCRTQGNPELLEPYVVPSSPGYGKLPGRRHQHLMAYFTTQIVHLDRSIPHSKVDKIQHWGAITFDGELREKSLTERDVSLYHENIFPRGFEVKGRISWDILNSVRRIFQFYTQNGWFWTYFWPSGSILTYEANIKHQRPRVDALNWFLLLKLRFEDVKFGSIFSGASWVKKV